MSFGFGLLVVLLALVTGYLGGGGNIMIVLQPFEWIIIVGIALGSFIISTPRELRKDIFSSLGRLGSGHRYNKEHYVEILLFLLKFLKYAQVNNDAELEKHIDNPDQSELFKGLNAIPESTHLSVFFCDSFRMLILGVRNKHEVDDMIESIIRSKFKKMQDVGIAVQAVGDALPGIGIVAAVTGVIIAMGAVGSDSAILSVKIASALVGTLIGVFLSYGIVTPIGKFLERLASTDITPFECMKAAIVMYTEGHPPSLCLEFARQILPANFKPTILELEDAVNLKVLNRIN